MFCLPDYKTWQKNYTETEKNLVMINKVPEEPRALGLTAYGLINQNVMYWNCEEQQWKSYDNGLKPTELAPVNCKQLASEVKSSGVFL